ncbi:MAG: hypothetical protein GY697_07360 [Desulfobacterales bacterium]|nr:hypothetical protein [Desulfobacterales bacterium]
MQRTRTAVVGLGRAICAYLVAGFQPEDWILDKVDTRDTDAIITLSVIEDVYVEDTKYGSALRFQWVKSPTSDRWARFTHTIAKRIGRYLERHGLLERDTENSYQSSNAVE